MHFGQIIILWSFCCKIFLYNRNTLVFISSPLFSIKTW